MLTQAAAACNLEIHCRREAVFPRVALATKAICAAEPGLAGIDVKETSTSQTNLRLPILLYHKVDKRFECGGTWVTPSQFEGHLRFLKEKRYDFCTLETLLAKGNTHGRRVAITFDDGYSALKEFAFPVLRDYCVPASVFVVTAFVGRKNLWDVNIGWRRFEHLGWRDIEAAAARGIRFYSHTATHRDLTRLGAEELSRELELSRETIENRLSQRAPYLSYPFGIYNAHVVEMVKKTGYEAAFTLFKRRGQNVDPLYCIERAAVYRIDTLGSLSRKLEGGPLAGAERLKARAINWCAAGTPVAKGLLGRMRKRTTPQPLESR
jgi:peptidoglycan/xylan/chitin deacetylase (PgdA/CDA1 family)